MKPFLSFVFFLILTTSIFSQSKNAKTVMDNYAAFGRGDIPAILATFAPDCVWIHPGNPDIIPFAGTFRGAEEIKEKFFGVIPTVVQLIEFVPSIVGEEGNTVIASIHIKGKVLTTGKAYESIGEMRWTLNDAGLVTEHKAIVDVSSLEAAFTPN